MDFSVKRLDHLGVIAGTMQELNLIEMVDTLLQADKQNILTPGEVVQAMIINGLGFSSKPTTLTPQFFATKPTDELIRPGISSEQLNRFKLGRVLDSIYEYGCEKFFNEIALQICIAEKIDITHVYNDTTTFSFEGNYDNQDEEVPVQITYGYSKAKRPDLKQMMLELCVSSDGGIPFIMRPWSGNKSDNQIFKERVQALCKTIKSSGDGITVIADSKLYSKENVTAMGNVHFITRVPASINKEVDYVRLAVKNNDWTVINDDYKFTSFDVVHYDVKQRWIVYYSKPANKRVQKTFEKKLQKIEKQLQSDLTTLQQKCFACEDDANSEMNALMKKYKYHTITNITIVPVEKYEKPGKPSATAKKSIVHYKITAAYSKIDDAINKTIDQDSCFVLATNIPLSNLPSAEVIKRYKQLDFVEKGFAFLKTPEFFADALFLKSASRIQAMLVIMTLSLFVYAIAQRRMREYLKRMEKTIPNQINKKTERPTLRWLFQCLEGIDLVRYVQENGVTATVITGLTDLRKMILSCFSPNIMKIYRMQ